MTDHREARLEDLHEDDRRLVLDLADAIQHARQNHTACEHDDLDPSCSFCHARVAVFTLRFRDIL